MTEAGPIHVLYATQTGNAEVVAEDVEEALTEAGVEARTAGLDEFTPAELAGLERVAIVCSSTGEGDVPDDAADFWDALQASDAPSLAGLTYSLLALGDRGYKNFCGGGKKIDHRLAELGATRMLDRVDCDAQYEQTAQEWTRSLVAAVTGSSAPIAPSSV